MAKKKTAKSNKSFLANPYFIMMVFFTLATAAGQYMIKAGLNKLEFTITGILTNYLVIFGLLLYVVLAFVFLKILKNLPLSIAYPVVGLSFAWVALISVLFLGEELAPIQWLGIIILLIGVGIVGGSSDG